MKLSDYLVAMNFNLTLKLYLYTHGEWVASFDDRLGNSIWVRGGYCASINLSAFGATPVEAVNNLLAKAAGKSLLDTGLKIPTLENDLAGRL